MRGVRAVVDFLSRGAMVMASIALCVRMALGRRASVVPGGHALRSDDRCQPLNGQRSREERNRNEPQQFPHRRLLYVSGL